MAEDITPDAETAEAEKPQDELVQWEDSEGRKHTGTRSGSAYKRHLAELKLAGTAEKAEEAAKADASAGTAESPEAVADGATADAPQDTTGPAQGGEAQAAPTDDKAGDAKDAPKPSRAYSARRG